MASTDPGSSFLEAGAFPAEQVSRLAMKGRARPSAVYGAHKWWARRPPESCRALLVAAALPEESTAEAFWTAYNSGDAVLGGHVVADPFLGGGSSLVEAQALGASVVGTDVDPLATLISAHELEPLDADGFRLAAEDLMNELKESCGRYFASPVEGEHALHYFYVRWVTCPTCGDRGPLYKSPVIVRDLGKLGAVVRDVAVTAFCPCCVRLVELGSHRKAFDCCGRRWRLDRGSYAAGLYTCGGCGCTATNEGLNVGRAPRRLVAVEVSGSARGARRVRAPLEEDLALEASAVEDLEQQASGLALPRAALADALKAHRPGIYGFTTFEELFSARQLLVFGKAFAWLRRQDLPWDLRRGLALALSNALTSNNLLCGYATDYGRLAPLFGVRDFALPTLSVELNPLHPTAGRGTLSATLRRVAGSKAGRADGEGTVEVRVGDAALADWGVPLTMVLTDPPYYDYISYSNLSLFYRVWLAAAGIVTGPIIGDPLYSNRASREQFSERLGVALGAVRQRLVHGGQVVFTYHANSAVAWDALVDGVHTAGLAVTAVVPLWADAKSPGHGHAGNMEWDLVLICRDAHSARWRVMDTADWHERAGSLTVSAADRAAWELAAKSINRYANE